MPETTRLGCGTPWAAYPAVIKCHHSHPLPVEIRAMDEINERIDVLADMLLEMEKCIAKLVTREEEMRTMLTALIATHPDKEVLAAMLEQIKTKTDANPLSTSPGGSFPDASTLARDTLAQILGKVQKKP